MILEGVGEVRLPDGEEGGDVKVRNDLHQELRGECEEGHGCDKLGLRGWNHSIATQIARACGCR